MNYIINFMNQPTGTKMQELFDFDLSPAEAAMFGMESILNVLPIIRVRERGDTISISGVWAGSLVADIKSVYKTARIGNNIFNEVNQRSFSFNRFFAFEFMAVLDELIANTRKTRVSKSTLEELKREMLANTWIGERKSTPPIDLKTSNYKRLNLPLLEKQAGFIEKYAEVVPKNNLRGMLLAAGAGTGKTINGFAWHMALDLDATIFVVPANSVKDVWVSTMETNFRKTPKYWHSMSGDKPSGKEEFFICHYEYLPKLLKVLNKIRAKRVGVWLDESHNFNEESAGRTNQFIQLVEDINPVGVVWASGTPIKAMAKESIPLFSTIDPMFTAEVRRSFMLMHASNQIKAMELLALRLDEVTFKVPKSEVVNNEKESIDHKVKIPDGDRFTLDSIKNKVLIFIDERLDFHGKNMPGYRMELEGYLVKVEPLVNPAILKRYRALMKDMNANFSIHSHREELLESRDIEKRHIMPNLLPTDRKSFRKVASRVRAIELVVRGEALGYIGKFRAECAVAMVPYADLSTIISESEKKTLIFTSYVAAVKETVKYVRSEGFDPVEIHGETNKHLPDLMKRIREDEKANPVVATYNSLSTAVPVIWCNTEVFLNLPFREYVMEQARARIDRLGQDAKVHFVTLYLDTGAAKNITTRTGDILEWSREAVDVLMNLNGADEEIMDADSLEAAFFKESESTAVIPKKARFL